VLSSGLGLAIYYSARVLIKKNISVSLSSQRRSKNLIKSSIFLYYRKQALQAIALEDVDIEPKKKKLST
tara:strand:- start:1674 stop:1880 length:207 start_codon:yes stop_codon:yes gene_type:complete